MEKNISESLATRRLTMIIAGRFCGPRSRPRERRALRRDGLERDATNEGVWDSSRARRAARGVFRLALGRGLLLVGTGLALGLLGALGAGRALTSLLYDVGSLDPGALLTAIVALAFVALLACWVPAAAPPGSIRLLPCVTNDA